MRRKNELFPVGFTPFESLSGMSPDAPMLIGLSGGADSRMLFELAARHCALSGGRFYACHVNHGIRGDEAIRDRDFCVKLAKECPQCADIFVLNADVPALARESGKSLELQARDTRYGFFQKVMRENAIPILVTAHNADDNLETLIFNLTRGSGARGMCGIPKRRPFGEGVVIRPMLGVSKSDVLRFCEDNSLEFVTDSTNSDTDYTRNLIRAQIVPLLEMINPAVRDSAARLSSSMAELCAHTDGLAEKYLSKDGAVSLSALSRADGYLLPHVLSLAASRSGVDIGAVHLDSLRRLCLNGKDGSSLSLPGSVRAVIHGDGLCFEADTRTKEEPIPFELPLTEGETLLPFGKVTAKTEGRGVKITVSLSPNCEKCVNNQNVYKLDINAHIIFDTIVRSDSVLFLRNRREGDRIRSGGMHKSVKKLMCDKKLPLAARDALPMLCLGDEILWIPGVASADGVKCQYL